MTLQNKLSANLINIAVAAALGFSSISAGAANNEFQYLAGKNINLSHNAFESQGYKKVHNETVDNQNQVVWWNADQKDCVVSNEKLGIVSTVYDVSKSDCDPYISSNGASTAVGIIAGVAAIAGIAALVNHNKHKNQDRENDARNAEEYDQGFNDGQNNYRRYGSHSEAYNNGFDAGREERNNRGTYNQYGNYNKNHNYNNYSHRSNNARYIKVADLMGVRASSGESELQSRGFEIAGGNKGWHNSYVNWVNYDAQECVSVTTSNGRFQTLNIVGMNQCV